MQTAWNKEDGLYHSLDYVGLDIIEISKISDLYELIRQEKEILR